MKKCENRTLVELTVNTGECTDRGSFTPYKRESDFPEIWLYYQGAVWFNPFFALDIFICSFRKCIQHTTRGQSNFPWSKLCCCYIFIVLKY